MHKISKISISYWIKRVFNPGVKNDIPLEESKILKWGIDSEFELINSSSKDTLVITSKATLGNKLLNVRTRPVLSAAFVIFGAVPGANTLILGSVKSNSKLVLSILTVNPLKLVPPVRFVNISL